MLLVLFVAYGLWFAHVLRSHASEEAGEGSRGNDPQELAHGANNAAVHGVDKADALPTAEAVAAALLWPKPRALADGSSSPRPSDHCNYTAGPPASGSSAHFMTALDAIPLPSCALAGPKSNIDHDALTLSAWVYVDARALSIQTVLANKAAGCEASREHHGFALFVNEWETSSQQAWLSWGNDISGCEELGTARGSVPVAVWTHLAATFSPVEGGSSGQMSARIYVNGVLAASTTERMSGLGHGVHKYGTEVVRRLQQVI